MAAEQLDRRFQKLDDLYTESLVFFFIGVIGAALSTTMYFFEPALTFLWYLYALSLSTFLLGGSIRRLRWIERRQIGLASGGIKKIKKTRRQQLREREQQ